MHQYPGGPHEVFRYTSCDALSIGFGTVLLLLVTIVGVGVGRLSTFDESVRQMTNDRIPKIVIGNDWIVSVLETARHTRNMLILDEKAAIRTTIR